MYAIRSYYGADKGGALEHRGVFVPVLYGLVKEDDVGKARIRQGRALPGGLEQGVPAKKGPVVRREEGEIPVS